MNTATASGLRIPVTPSVSMDKLQVNTATASGLRIPINPRSPIKASSHRDPKNRIVIRASLSQDNRRMVAAAANSIITLNYVRHGWSGRLSHAGGGVG